MGKTGGNRLSQSRIKLFPDIPIKGSLIMKTYFLPRFSSFWVGSPSTAGTVWPPRVSNEEPSQLPEYFQLSRQRGATEVARAATHTSAVARGRASSKGSEGSKAK